MYEIHVLGFFFRCTTIHEGGFSVYGVVVLKS